MTTLFQWLLLMFVFYGVYVIAKALSETCYAVGGIAGVVNSAAMTMLEERVYQEVLGITETTSQQVWATLTIDKLGLALDYQDELEETIAGYEKTFEKEIDSGRFDIKAAYARAVVRIVVREFWLGESMRAEMEGRGGLFGGWSDNGADGED